ncbi:MAG: PAS domain S-box protein [Chthoniobacter sp.]|uniref:PAS domain-containing hybrid sensor histidine kinase/response regulator n=1 Tax=Chthoniobacter sp. TaxID=2510640 RepID=UPI0032AC91D7
MNSNITNPTTETPNSAAPLDERQVAQALAASELRYRRLFESAKDGILILDAETGMVVDVNPFLVSLLGFSHEEFLGKAIWQLGVFKDVVANEEKFAELKEKEYVRYESLPLEARDGRRIEVEFVSNVYLVSGAKVIQCNVRDITERKRAETHLKLLETCLARLNDMVVITEAAPLSEPGPRMVFVNDAFLRCTGYTRGEVIGQSPRILQGPNTSRSELDRIHAALDAGIPVRAELINYRKSGEEYWIELDIVPVLDPAGLATHFVAVERDITDRRRVEARFRRLVDSNAQGVMFWNTAGAISGANDAFLQLVGYTREDMEAGRMNWLAMTPPEYADLDRRALEEITAKGIFSPFEKEYFRKDGSRVPLLVGAAAFEDAPTEGVCFALDLTERKKLEQQFFRAQRMESIGTLAGGIAHDLNNVLSPIMMSLEVLKMKFTEASSQELLAILQTSAQRGSDLVKQVLSFARGVEGQRIEVQVQHLIQEIEKIANETFLKHIRVLTVFPRDLWIVLGDPTQLHQVLMNLCVNARDAMPEGGTLTISAENLTLDAHYAGMSINPEARPGPYVFLQVRDTGTGMPGDVIDKIFDPFFTTKGVGNGTGLGLSTTLGIVKSHGGFIRVYSEMGKGTTFKIYLPAQPVGSAEAAAKTAGSLPRGHDELILVVDDEDAVCQITRQTLETFGYRAILAANGVEALVVYAAHRAEIAVVLTDMMMPLMDGPATIRALLQMNPDACVIAASGLAASDHVAQATSLGVKHFLPKPYTAETLLKVLREVLPLRL